jgi:hypothetical protein
VTSLAHLNVGHLCFIWVDEWKVQPVIKPEVTYACETWVIKDYIEKLLAFGRKNTQKNVWTL